MKLTRHQVKRIYGEFIAKRNSSVYIIDDLAVIFRQHWFRPAVLDRDGQWRYATDEECKVCKIDEQVM